MLSEVTHMMALATPTVARPQRLGQACSPVAHLQVALVRVLRQLADHKVMHRTRPAMIWTSEPLIMLLMFFNPVLVRRGRACSQPAAYGAAPRTQVKTRS